MIQVFLEQRHRWLLIERALIFIVAMRSSALV
jgi:hypothetical protein